MRDILTSIRYVADTSSAGLLPGDIAHLCLIPPSVLVDNIMYLLMLLCKVCWSRISIHFHGTHPCAMIGSSVVCLCQMRLHLAFPSGFDTMIGCEHMHASAAELAG